MATLVLQQVRNILPSKHTGERCAADHETHMYTMSLFIDVLLGGCWIATRFGDAQYGRCHPVRAWADWPALRQRVAFYIMHLRAVLFWAHCYSESTVFATAHCNIDDKSTCTNTYFKTLSPTAQPAPTPAHFAVPRADGTLSGFTVSRHL